MSPEPGFSGNDFFYFSELNKALLNTKTLWYSSPYENKIKIRSNSVFYWSRTEVTFRPIETGTEVTINYHGTLLAYILYGTFLVSFLGSIIFLLVKGQVETFSPLLALLLFGIPLSLIPFFLRKIQNNIIQKLEYS